MQGNGWNQTMTCREEEQDEEPQFLVSLDCSHTQILPASKLAKPVRRENAYTRAPMYLCRDCYTRKGGSCSIDPVHAVRSITEILSSMLMRRRKERG
jgi:hypothetical protein